MDIIIFIALGACVVLSDVLSFLLPWLMPKTECFAANIPAEKWSDHRLMSMRTTYAALMGLASIVSAVLLACSFLYVGDQNSLAAFLWLFCLSIFVPLVCSFLLMLHFRKKVIRLATNEHWYGKSVSRATIIGVSAAQPISCKWNLLYLPIIVATALIIWINYGLLPQSIPMQVDMQGNIARSVPLSPATAFFPVYIECFFAAIFTLYHVMITRSKHPFDEGKPTANALAYGAFIHVQTLMLCAGGIGITTCVGLLITLAMLNVLSIVQAGAVIVVPVVILVTVFMLISVAYGQNGSRLAERIANEVAKQTRGETIDATGEPYANSSCAGASNTGAEGGNNAGSEASGDASSADLAHTEALEQPTSDDNKHWKAGVFYVNSADSAIIVPKRFGIGWTINFARPGAWALILLFVAITCFFSFLCVAVA